MEVVGVTLGAMPLIIAAMEYYPKVKELGTQYWKFRRTRQDELRRVAFCKELLKLHIQALLQMSSAEVEELLKNPADKTWRSVNVEAQIKRRLAGSYDAYSGILSIAERQTAKVMKAAKVDDEAFKTYLVQAVANGSDAEDLKIRATAFFRNVAVHSRIGIQALGHREREQMLKELETSIRRLKELLDAVDGVSETNKAHQIVKNYRIPPAMQGFWHRAERIWHLIHGHLSCACRPKHCARLWFDRSSMAQDSLSLVFLFDKAMPWTAEPWKRRQLKIHRPTTQCSCSYHSDQRIATSQEPPTTPMITMQPTDAASVSGSGQVPQVPYHAAPSPPTSIISAHGLCETLKHYETEHECLGTLCSTDDDYSYHVLPNQDNELYDFVLLSSMLDPNARPFFELRPRIKLAAMLASAHLRYFGTLWVPDRWRLRDICFPKDPQDASRVQFNMPYILANFEDPSAARTQHKPTIDQGFVTLGIVLLELCFGRPLEMHEMWSHANGILNSDDPFHRLYVAGLWAKTIDLMIDGPEYVKAVEWCLREAPTNHRDEKWRGEFAMNVLGPLLKCANLLS